MSSKFSSRGSAMKLLLGRPQHQVFGAFDLMRSRVGLTFVRAYFCRGTRGSATLNSLVSPIPQKIHVELAQFRAERRMDSRGSNLVPSRDRLSSIR
jgi:hypothetical protein